MTPEVRQNIAALPFNYTTWVLAAIGYLVAYWLELPEAERQALLAAYPWLKHAAAIGAPVAYVLAKITPQLGVKPIVAPPPALTSGEALGRAGDFAPTVPQPGALSAADIDALLRADRILKAQRAGGAS